MIGGALVMVPAALALPSLDAIARAGPGPARHVHRPPSSSPSSRRHPDRRRRWCPGAPGRGLGTMIACGTLGRASPRSRRPACSSVGLTATAMLGAAFALVAGIAMALRRRLVLAAS